MLGRKKNPQIPLFFWNTGRAILLQRPRQAFIAKEKGAQSLEPGLQEDWGRTEGFKDGLGGPRQLLCLLARAYVR